MRRLALAFIVMLLFSTAAMAVDIAISTQANWWAQNAADREMQEIADNVTEATVEQFTAGDHDALAEWVIAHTGNGESDLLILCGQLPATIYAPGNTQPDDSLVELFLDDGNCVVNTGDWMFYVVNGGTANGSAALPTVMDIASMEMWDDNLTVTVTEEGKLYTPSLVDFQTDRAIHFDQLQGDWYPELILAVAADGNRAEPCIVRNSTTGGRIGIFFQTAGQDNDPRGEVMSEWINNWYIPITKDPEIAGKPSPKNTASDVLRDTVLSWKAADSAVAHDVYLGTAFGDVNDATRTNPLGVLVAQGQTATTYAPADVLEFGATYYWRVDEVLAGNAIAKGDVWSFGVETLTYLIQNIIATSNTTSTDAQGPERLVDGSGLNADDQHSNDTNAMWSGTPNPDEPSYVQFEFDGVYKLHEMVVWNYNMQFEAFLGYGVKLATIECSQNGTDWTSLGDFEFAQGTGTNTYAANTTVSLQGAAAKFVRLTVNSNFSGSTVAYGMSEVRFTSIPVVATQPQPADGAVNVAVDATLSWRHGREAVSHEVYLGTDPNALVLDGTTNQSSYAPTALNLDTTYYWQVVEVNTAEAVSTWAGNIWSFSTQESLVVENFEGYTDDWEAGEAIWQTWIDGWEDNANGSQVGYTASPFAEQNIVHGGKQSMPLTFDNAGAGSISQADRTFASAQNWAANGINSLSLWFYGASGNTGQLYVKINGTKVAYDGDASDIATLQWQPWNIDLTAVAANLSSVTTLTVGVEGAGSGIVYIDDIRLYGKTPQRLAPAAPDAANLVARYALDGNANDSSGNGANGTEMGGFMYVDGVNGQALNVDGAGGYIEIDDTSKWPAGTSPRTMAAWLKSRSIEGGFHFALAYGTPATAQAMFLGINGADYYGGGYGDDLMVPGVWVAEEWYHTSLSYDGTTARLYLNGIEIASGSKTWPLVLQRGRIGQQVNDFSEFWDGDVDDVCIYNIALSAEEIAYLAGKTAPTHVPF